MALPQSGALRVAAVVALIAIGAGLQWFIGAQSDGLVNTLRWTVRDQASQVVAYDVYRADGDELTFELLTSVPIETGQETTGGNPGYEFHDKTIRGDTRYRYYLEAVTASGGRHRLPGVAEAQPKLAAVSANADGLAALLLGMALFLAALSGALGRWNPIGDEKEYLDRAGKDDPHAPDLYLRMPGFVTLTRWLTGGGVKPNRARWLSYGGVMLANAMTASLAVAMGGSPIVVALALLLGLEFAIFALRLWPEPLLTVAHIAILWVLIAAPPGFPAALAMGLVVAFALWIRLEQLVLLPAVGVVWLLSENPVGPAQWLALVSPAAFMVALVSLRNRARYGSFWPDTTWRFNANLAVHEATFGPHVVHIESSIRETVRRARNDQPAGTGRFGVAMVGSLVLGALRRMIAFVGKDTFVRDRLLPPRGRGFANVRGLPFFEVWLRWGYPSLVASAVVAAWFAGNWPMYLIPAVALFLACTLFHSRTRYRQLLVPALVLWLADSVSRLEVGLSVTVWTFLALMVIALGALSLREED